MLGDVDLRGDDGAVQPFVEQQVGAARQILPIGEGADRRPVQRGVIVVVDVVARAAETALAVAAEDLLELGQQIGFLAEMAEVVVAPEARLDGRPLHVGAPEAMERIALDEGGGDVLAAEDVLERLTHRRRAGARGTRDRDDGMFG